MWKRGCGCPGDEWWGEVSQPPLFCAFRITALCCVLHLGFIVAHWCVHCYMNSLLISFSRWGCMNIQINPSIHVHTVTPATRSLIPSSSMQQHPQCELVWDNSSNKCFFALLLRSTWIYGSLSFCLEVAWSASVLPMSQQVNLVYCLLSSAPKSSVGWKEEMLLFLWLTPSVSCATRVANCRCS